MEALTPPDHPYAVIMIKSPQGRWAVIPDQNPLCVEILKLEFNDVTRDEDGQRMSEEQARQVVQFAVRLNSEGSEHLIVQCRGGQCRSAAIAAALTQIRTGDSSFYFNHDFYRPNIDVYRKVLAAAKEEFDKYVEDEDREILDEHFDGNRKYAAVLRERLEEKKAFFNKNIELGRR